MKMLTAKEEEIMGYFWEKGPLFVKQLLDFYDEPRPHFNTLSTIVRGLEEKGMAQDNISIPNKAIRLKRWNVSRLSNRR